MYLNKSLSGFALLAVASAAAAAPSGASVVDNSATVEHNGSVTNVTVHSNKAIINWQDFSIAKGEEVNFIDNANSVTLNRVTGNKASQIHGKLTATGKVFLVNPNGIVFGQNATIDVGGLVASTTNISDKNFIAGYETGKYKFDQATPGSAITIESSGVTFANTGVAVLVAPSVSNQGFIQADVGKLVLASGEIFTLDLYGDDLITFDAAPLLGQVTSGEIHNTGNEVVLMAAVADDILESMINVDGYIEANKVILSGDTIRFVGPGEVDAAQTDVYYTEDDYRTPINYASLIAGDTQTHLWVHNADDLQRIQQTRNKNDSTLSNNYALSGDIDLTGINFRPIGRDANDATKNNAYTGTFDFNNHEISNLNIEQETPDRSIGRVRNEIHTGLFAKLDGATVIDANITNANVDGNYYWITRFGEKLNYYKQSTGVLAGAANNTTLLGETNIQAENVAGQRYVGGVLGKATGDINVDGDFNVSADTLSAQIFRLGGAIGIIENAQVNFNDDVSVDIGNFTPDYHASVTGGFAGELNNSAIAFAKTPTLASENVAGAINVGGYFGYVYNSSITGDLLNTSDVYARSGTAGGIAGNFNDSTINGTLINKGNISGDSFAGGIAGIIHNTDISQAGNHGNITVENSYAGGIAGRAQQSDLSFIYSTDQDSTVQGADIIGGLVGQLRDGATITNAIVANNVVATNGAAGGVVGHVYGNAINDGTAMGATALSNVLALNNSVTGNDAGTIAGHAYGYFAQSDSLHDAARNEGKGLALQAVGNDLGINIFTVTDNITDDYYDNQTIYEAAGLDFTSDWHIVKTQPQDYYASLQWCGLACTVELIGSRSALAASLNSQNGQSGQIVDSQQNDTILLSSDEFSAYYSSLEYHSLLEGLNQESSDYMGERLSADVVSQTTVIETFSKDYYRNRDLDKANSKRHDLDAQLIDALIDISASN